MQRTHIEKEAFSGSVGTGETTGIGERVYDLPGGVFELVETLCSTETAVSIQRGILSHRCSY